MGTVSWVVVEQTQFAHLADVPNEDLHEEQKPNYRFGAQ